MSRLRYVRQSDGTYINSSWNGSASYNTVSFDMCMSNPIVFSCVNIRANYLSKVKFGVKEKDGTINFEDESLNILNNPNIYESGEEFLRKYEIFRLIYGWVYQKTFMPVGYAPEAIYNLDPSLITFPDFKGKFLAWKEEDVNELKAVKFDYDDNGEKRSFAFKDVITFFDVANTNKDNPYISISRINALSKEVNNINLMGDAENRSTKTIGKQLIFSTENKNKEKGGFLSGDVPLSTNDMKSINSNLNDTTGFKSKFSEKQLGMLDTSVKLKDLGLNDGRSHNTGVIIRAFGLTNELYDYHTKGSTFENQEKAELRFIQNVVQPIADDLANSYTKSFGDVNRPFVASLEHVPTMQVVENTKADRALKISTAIKNLVSSGIEKDAALQLMNDLGVNTNIHE